MIKCKISKILSIRVDTLIMKNNNRIIYTIQYLLNKIINLLFLNNWFNSSNITKHQYLRDDYLKKINLSQKLQGIKFHSNLHKMFSIS